MDLVIKTLAEASLGWKNFGTYNKDRDFYTFNNKYVRDFIRRKIIKLNDNEISYIVDEYLKYINTSRDELKWWWIWKWWKNYRKINKKELDNYLDKKLGEMETNKEMQKINKMIC